MKTKYRIVFSLFLVGVALAIPVSSLAEEATNEPAKAVSEEQPYKPKTKAELRKMLTPLQFKVTQLEGTERAFRNEYWDNKRQGTYECIVCGRELFSSKTKYKSGTGWPSFYKPLEKESVGYKIDRGWIYDRTEVHCARCNAHLGHVFDDGPRPTGKRYCMNSASLKFVPAKETGEEATQKKSLRAE